MSSDSVLSVCLPSLRSSDSALSVQACVCGPFPQELRLRPHRVSIVLSSSPSGAQTPPSACVYRPVVFSLSVCLSSCRFLPQRVSIVLSSPLSGAGGYADNSMGVVATTGDGESFVKTCLAYRIAMLMQNGNSLIHNVMTSSVEDFGVKIGKFSKSVFY